MRRVTGVFLMLFALILSVVAGVAGADKKNFAVPARELVAYTTLPPEIVSVLSEEYEKSSRVRVNFVPMAAPELLQKMSNERAADLVLADSAVLEAVADLNLLAPHISETSDGVKDDFKDARDRWTGIWYDPVIFCANKDFLRTLGDIPDTWNDLAAARKIRIGITDFLAADASANLLTQMIENIGDAGTYEIWRGVHGKVVQYTKFLSNPVRQAGMGEADISIAVESETLRYIGDNYPLKIIYPADGTAYMLTGIGIGGGGVAAENFADWLLSDEAYLALQKSGFYFVPTNPRTLAYKTFAGKNLELWERANFSAEQRREYLDRWVREVRLER